MNITGKRVNFIGIQSAHTVACEGYKQTPLRTGYEQVVAHRTGDLFATAAKANGKVISVSDTGAVVEYDNGEKKGIEIGRRYGKVGDLSIPHEIVTSLKEGQKFKEGDILAYNTGFFEQDLLNPSNIVWKSSIIVKTALLESPETFEDSSSISLRVSEKLKMRATKVKNVVVSFNQNVHKIVKPGTAVESEDILCIIEDEITANTELFDEESLDTLKVLGAQTPQAKVKGVVERIEVYYHGDKEDMSESLRTLATASDRELAKRQRSVGKEAFTGSVNDNFRIEGDPIGLDTACIRFYITSDVPAGLGDKGVFGNQMKTVFGNIMTEEIVTESGVVVDAFFGANSIFNRIVNSPFIIGTTTTLLDVIGKKAVEIYNKS